MREAFSQREAVEELTDRIKQRGQTVGFDVIRVAPAVSPPGFHPLLEWIANGYHADMDWMDRRRGAYETPDGVLPGTRSVIVAAVNYQNQPPTPNATARISRYAWGTEDYHSVLKRMLKQLAAEIHATVAGSKSRIVVDTAPLLERDFARLAGIGWFGKNTMLISREIGSWFFLGAILTTAELDYDQPFVGDYCGSCTKCLDACPTNAFPTPGVLDANRCISYLTIERRSKPIALDLRPGMQDWVFGCDICQEVCPWNRFAPTTSPPEFHPRNEILNLTIGDLLRLTEQDFDRRFARTPLHRTGRNAVVRNAAIAAGNSRNDSLRPQLEALQQDTSEMVAEAAKWALAELSKSH